MSVRLAGVVLATSGVLTAVACGSSEAGFDSGAGGSAEGGSKASGGGAGGGAGNSGAGGARAAGAGGGDFAGENQGDSGAGAAAGGGASQGGRSTGGANAGAGSNSGGVSSGGVSSGGVSSGGVSSGGVSSGGVSSGGVSSGGVSSGGAKADGGSVGGSKGGAGGGGNASGSSGGAAGAAGSGGQGGTQAVDCGNGPDCASGEVCLQIVVTMGPTETTTYRCVTNPCVDLTLACSCAGDTCRDINPSAVCSLAEPAISRLRCSAGGVCAAPDTPIATPDGDRPIAGLRVGDLVYSVDDRRFVAVPVLRASRTPVMGHVVVHLETERGARLDVSGPHPTADGRTFADLRVGDRLDGATIVVRELVPYPYDATYDILPASSSGAYVASGLLIGSSLK